MLFVVAVIGVEEIAYLTNLVLEMNSIYLGIVKFAICVRSVENQQNSRRGLASQLLSQPLHTE